MSSAARTGGALPAVAFDPATAVRRGRSTALVVAVATVLAAVNAAVGIGSKSIARDEGFSVSTSLRSWSSLVRLSLHTETNAWLYAFALKAWSSFGTSMTVLRALSALAFVATVPLVAELARRLFGARVAAVTAVLVAVNGSMLMHAQLVRAYPFGVAATALGALVFVEEVRNPRRATIAAWIAVSVVAVQFNVYTFLACVAEVAALVALPAAERRWGRRVLALGAVAAVLGPVLLAISSHEEGQGLYSLGRAEVLNVANVYAGRGGAIGLLAFGVGGGAAVWLAWRARTGRPASAAPAAVAPASGLAPVAPGDAVVAAYAPALLVAWAVVPVTLLLAASLLTYPTFVGRYVLSSVPALVIALAVTIDRLSRAAAPRRPVALLGAAALAVGGAAGTYTWHTDGGTENWTAAAHYVFDRGAPDESLVIAPDVARLFFEYERGRSSPYTGPEPGWPAQPWGGYGTGDHLYRSPSAAEMAIAVRSARRVWVVVGREQPNTSVMAERLRSLGPTFRLVEQQTFTGPVDIYLYERVTP